MKFDNTGSCYLKRRDDSSYATIVTSPTYPALALPPRPGNDSNVVLKVPFLPLDLTLEPVLSGQESVFLGRNWNSAISWLAQAPGPGPGPQGLGTSYQDLASDQAALNTFPGDAEDQLSSTWADYWKPLPDPTPAATANTSAATSAHGGGLSTNVLAGIGAGAGAISLAVISGLGLFFWRKRKSAGAARAEHLHPPVYPDGAYDLKTFSPSTVNSKRPSYSSLKELATMRSPPNAQLPGHWSPVELPARQDPQEMGLRSPRYP